MALELRLRPPVIELDEATHQYTVDGVPKRSVSEILRPLMDDLSRIPAHHLANAKHRGIQIDRMCSWIMQDREDLLNDYIFGLDEEQFKAFESESEPFVAAYRRFWMIAGHNPRNVRVQPKLYCAEFDFCGTPDWDTPRTVHDNKATDKCSRVWGLQLAGYELAHGAATDSAIVWLRPKLKTHQCEVHPRSEGNRRIFSKLDFDVVKAACRGDYDAEVIQRWRAGE